MPDSTITEKRKKEMEGKRVETCYGTFHSIQFGRTKMNPPTTMEFPYEGGRDPNGGDKTQSRVPRECDANSCG